MRRLKTAEMKFMSCKAGYTFTEEIFRYFRTQPKKTARYKQK